VSNRVHTVYSALLDGLMCVTPPFLACPLTKLNGTDFQNCFCSFFLGFIVSQPVNFCLFLLSSMKDSGQAIPLVVESCIRYINLYGKLTQQY